MKKTLFLLLFCATINGIAQNIRVTAAAAYMLPDFKITELRTVTPGINLYARGQWQVGNNFVIGPTVFYQYQNTAFEGDIQFFENYSGLGLGFQYVNSGFFTGIDACMSFWQGGNGLNAVSFNRELGLLTNMQFGYMFGKLGVEAGLSIHAISYYDLFSTTHANVYLGVTYLFKISD